MLGQAHHFRAYAPEQIPYAVNRYTNEAKRLYGVMDRRLDGRDWFADDYSIADIAIFPWLRSWERQGIVLDEFPNVKRWFPKIEARPAVPRGPKVRSAHQHKGPLAEQQQEVLFRPTQNHRRKHHLP